ncbi:MAG TPA: L-fucose:H+ symporter permease [Acidobacteriaceae bacterium]|nr:L-fucose:H+ symporter permease [Acidobacteriaceae bacterium]
MQSMPSNPASHTKHYAEKPSIFPAGQMLPFMLTTIVFFVWGMSNNLTDILVQQFRKSFELSLLQAQLVQTAVFLAYGTLAIPGALIARRFGYKAGLLIGLIVFGVGTLLFWPAAIMAQYTPFLIALFVVGCGSSILETAANPLVARFGDPDSAERRLNFSQAFNPPGSIVGAAVGTFFIFSGIEKSAGEIAQMKVDGTYAAYVHSEILRVVPTFVGLGLFVLLLAALIAFTRYPVIRDSQIDIDIAQIQTEKWHTVMARLVRNPRLIFAVVAQFFYVGTQIGSWSTLIPYMRAYTGVAEKTAGYYLTGSLVAFAIGRIICTWLMRYISPGKLIGVYAVVNAILLCVGVASPGMIGSYAIVLTSFFMSGMYPTIFALGVHGLGEDTKLGGSLLVMGISGGAVFPPLMGWVTRMTGSTALGYILPAAGYIVVALYALTASRPAQGATAAHAS